MTQDTRASFELQDIAGGVTDGVGGVSSRGLTPYQCEVLTSCLETIQIYFHAGGRGLKRSFLQRSPELHNLQQALALYSQTTDALLKDYVTSEIYIMGMVASLLLQLLFILHRSFYVNHDNNGNLRKESCDRATPYLF